MLLGGEALGSGGVVVAVVKSHSVGKSSLGYSEHQMLAINGSGIGGTNSIMNCPHGSTKTLYVQLGIFASFLLSPCGEREDE